MENPIVESSILPTEAVDYLNNIETDKTKIDEDAKVQAAKTELLDHCTGFQQRSASWRAASYESDWLKWQRNVDGVFDPAIAAKKEAWQSKVHIGLTASHRETVHSHIFKTMVGINPPLEVAARYDLGEEDQADNIRDITIRELDKTSWGIEIDKTMNDADTFGSGFVRRSYKTTIEKRKLRKERTEQFTDDLNPMGMMGYAARAATGKLRKEFVMQEEDVITYRGLCLSHVSIWDVYPDPKALQIPGSPLALRFHATYEDIIKGIEEDYYLPSAAIDLKNEKAGRKFSPGEDSVNASRAVGDANSDKTEYQQDFELFEMFARLPKKWIYAIMGEQFENGEELVPARVIFHKKAVIGVEINDDYEGEPTVDKIDYMPRNGSFYGGGIPWMVSSSQDVINEIVNQRLDNGAQALNHTYAVIEKALVNAKQDLVSSPGRSIRLDAKYCPNGDVRNAITILPVNDTPLRAGFSEVNDAERWAQERSSANTVMMGSSSAGRDGTNTLGEKQMMKESAGEKLSYIGLRMEIDFLQKLFRGVWKTIYTHITHEDIEESIGPERAKSFILVSPEEICRDYVYRPMGVFTMENKSQLQAQIMQVRQNFLGAPWVNDEAFFDACFRNIDQDPAKFKKDEGQILEDQAMQIQPGMGQEGPQMGYMFPVDTTGAPMEAPGPAMPPTHPGIQG